MTGVVVDASVALAWCFPDKASEYADGVLVALEGKTMLLVGERQKRLRAPQIQRFTTLVENLSLIQDAPPLGEQVSNVLPIAREHGLSAYDAAYLELAIRHGIPLATLDGKLQKAAARAGVQIFPGEAA